MTPAMSQNAPKKSLLRRLTKAASLFLLIIVALLLVAFLVVFRAAIYHRLVTFPAEKNAWESIRAQREQVVLDDGWMEIRGACHSHSELSHDSEIPFPEILAALKQADLDFICMSDHTIDGKADYSLGWRGDHEGVIFIRGFEMAHGFMPWGLPDDTILDNAMEPRALARLIAEKNGLLFFAHPEEERLWDLPELTGMEIYNLHADFKDEKLADLLPDLILNLSAYPDQTLRLIFDRQTEILKHWDALNQKRKIVGIAANDAHQNTGIRGYVTEQDTFQLRERGSADVIKEWKLNPFSKLLLQTLFGNWQGTRELFSITLDPYVQSLRYVNTHLLVTEKSEAAILDALKAGRCFVAFDMIADARGFTFVAENGPQKAVMGEQISFSPDLTFLAESPLPCHFALVRNGEREAEQTGRMFVWKAQSSGVYRLEAELQVRNEWIPWVYTNPIFVKEN